MIVFKCPNCPTKLRVASTLAGRRMRCPKCQGLGVVPAAAGSSTGPPLPPLPGALAPAPELEPTTEHVPFLEAATEEEDEHEGDPRQEEDVVDLPAGAEPEVRDAQPGERQTRKAKKKSKRARQRPTGPRSWRVQYGLDADPDNPDRVPLFWSPARIGGIISIAVAIILFVLFFVLLDRWSDEITFARRSVLWALVGGGFGLGLSVRVVLSVLVFTPMFAFTLRLEVLPWSTRILVMIFLSGAIGALIIGVWYFVRGHE